MVATVPMPYCGASQGSSRNVLSPNWILLVADLFDFHMIYLLKCLLKATCSLVRFVVFIIQGEALAGKEQKSMQSATI